MVNYSQGLGLETLVPSSVNTAVLAFTLAFDIVVFLLTAWKIKPWNTAPTQLTRRVLQEGLLYVLLV